LRPILSPLSYRDRRPLQRRNMKSWFVARRVPFFTKSNRSCGFAAVCQQRCDESAIERILSVGIGSFKDVPTGICCRHVASEGLFASALVR
jgi:hypothetical protein